MVDGISTQSNYTKIKIRKVNKNFKTIKMSVWDVIHAYYTRSEEGEARIPQIIIIKIRYTSLAPVMYILYLHACKGVGKTFKK